jgi:hypothetical protein
MHHHPSSLVVIALLALGAVGAAAQDEGLKQVQALIKRANSTVGSIDDAKLQIQKTMDAYNAVLAPETTDRRGAYKKLQKEMATTEKKRVEVSARAKEMNTDADTLFKSWESSTASIQSPEMRKKSEDRLAKTKTRYAEIGTTGQKAAALYDPFIKTLHDQVEFLGHDLNADAIKSLAPDAAKLNAQANELYAAIDKTTAAANSNIAALKPE